jgi:hypothetical protein
MVKITKKNTTPNAPVMTNLPLTISDTPLVIDLPDGQKLVIGKMSQGSVIEVATWRGTGRPDSRTSRLMLGMSHVIGATQSDTSPSVSVPEPAKVFPDTRFEIRTLISRISFSPLLDKLKKFKLEAPKRIQAIKSDEPKEQDTNTEIDAWLNEITRKAEAKRISLNNAATKAPIKKSTKSSKKR